MNIQIGSETSSNQFSGKKLNQTELSFLRASRQSAMTQDNPFKWALEEFDRESETQIIVQRRRRIVQDIRRLHE